MSLTALKYEAEFKTIECYRCQMIFAVTAYFMERRREDHANFFCPAGHQQHYPHETKLEKAERKAVMLADQVRMEREQREKLERKLKRVHRGVCPECNRSFANVERHMKTKHKEHK